MQKWDFPIPNGTCNVREAHVMSGKKTHNQGTGYPSWRDGFAVRMAASGLGCIERLAVWRVRVLNFGEAVDGSFSIEG